DTYWATEDGVSDAWLVLDLGKSIAFNVVSLREYLPLGQRVEEFALDQWRSGSWQEFYKGTSIGNLRLLRTGFISTDRIRLRITRSAVCPAITQVGLFSEPSTVR
ncbi:MAG: alpha-L-fucosidase, partial [bacterium]